MKRPVKNCIAINKYKFAHIGILTDYLTLESGRLKMALFMTQFIEGDKLTEAGVHLAMTLKAQGCDKKACVGCAFSDGKGQGQPGENCYVGAVGINREKDDQILDIYSTMP